MTSQNADAESRNTITTIAEAKQYLKQHWWEGTTCLCCNQFVKLYPRTITSSMARGLIALYHINHDLKTWIHVPTEFNRRSMMNSMGDFAKMKEWGLIDEKPNDDDPDKTNSGFWRITMRGIEFVLLQAKVPKYIIFYNQKAYHHIKPKGENPMIDISDALGTKFSYQELIGQAA